MKQCNTKWINPIFAVFRSIHAFRNIIHREKRINVVYWTRPFLWKARHQKANGCQGTFQKETGT